MHDQIYRLNYVLWKSAICWKFMKIESLLSRIILGMFFSGLSIVLMYLSTTVCRSLPNSSSVSTSSRMTALFILLSITFLWKCQRLTLSDTQHRQLCPRKWSFQYFAHLEHRQVSTLLLSSQSQKFELSILKYSRTKLH